MDYYGRYWKVKKKNHKGFANMPPEWDSINLNRVLNVLSPYCKGKVLDVGCGTGYFTEQLSRIPAVKSVIGLDISQTAIDIAKSNYPGIVFKCSIAEKMNLSSSAFDFISSVEVIEHIIDVDQMLGEFYRLLKPGGKLLLTTTDFNWPKKVLVAAFFWDRYFYPNNPHIRFFTKKTLQNILNDNGFKIIKYVWHGSYLGLMPKGQIVVAEKVRR